MNMQRGQIELFWGCAKKKIFLRNKGSIFNLATPNKIFGGDSSLKNVPSAPSF